MNSREIGDIGEDFTAEFLEKKGCEIIERNFTVKGGEIDIIALKGGLIHFVEVKTRKKNSLLSGEQAVNSAKKRFLIRAAERWLSKQENEYNCVFDVASVELDGETVTDFRYYQRAFTASEI